MNKQSQHPEALVSQIEKAMVDAFYLYNLVEERYEFMSANSKNITGASPDFYYEGNDFINTFIHPEDRENATIAYKSIIENEQEQKIDFRIIDNHQIRWVHEEFYPIFNDVGKLIKVAGVISDITESVERENELKRIQDNTRLLSEIGLEVGQHLNVRSIVKSIYNRLNEMMDAEFFGIGLIDKTNNCIDFPYVLENDKEVETSIPLNKNVLATICVKRDEALFLDEYLVDYKKYTYEPLENMEGDQPESVMYVPLHSNDGVFGVITIQSRKKNAYSKTDLQFLKNLSIYVARSLINANLYETMEQMVKERTAKVLEQKKELEKAYKSAALLSEMGTDLSTTLYLDEIFGKLHKNLSKLLDAEIFGVRILNKKEQTIHYKYDIESGESDETVIVPLSDKDNYTVWCVMNNKSIHINDNINEYQKYVNEIKVPTGKMPASLLFVPIVHDNEVLGAITVQSFEKNAYNKRHLNIIKTLAFYTGIAMSNADLYESLEHKVELRTNELKQANKSVMDSINYTKNIQDATLTSKNDIKALLPNSFILFKPRDVVSGDFYRIDKIDNKKGDDLISILVADCTGHGVPGATLAILCSSIIQQSYDQSSVNSPSETLEFSRKSLNDLFANSKETIYDGMDVALGVLNPKTYKFSFSGALNNCYIFRGDEVIVINGDRMHVGYSEKENSFTTHKIQLQPKDFVVFSTDGFYDQFGGDKFKKFGRKKFLNILQDLKRETPNEQHHQLNEIFNKWKGKNEQTDDVCVFGFRLD